jgi:hypothetical protein
MNANNTARTRQTLWTWPRFGAERSEAIVSVEPESDTPTYESD